MTRTYFKTIKPEKRHWDTMNLGHGYIESAVVILESLTSRQTNHPGVSVGIPMLFNLRQGVENFFKGAILALESEHPASHDLGVLVQAYEAIVSDKQLTPEFHAKRESIDQIIEWDEKAASQRRNIHGQPLRYWYDLDGNPFFPGVTLSEDYLRNIVEHSREECCRIHFLLIHLIQPQKSGVLLQPWWEPEHLFDRRCEVEGRLNP